mgnify:CR=1 FL=1
MSLIFVFINYDILVTESNVPIIAGSVTAVIAIIAACIMGIVFYCRKKKPVIRNTLVTKKFFNIKHLITI